MLMGVVDKAAAAFELVKAPHELELLLQLVLPLSSLPSKSKLAAARKLLSEAKQRRTSAAMTKTKQAFSTLQPLVRRVCDFGLFRSLQEGLEMSTSAL